MKSIELKYESIFINKIEYLIQSLKDRQQFFDTDHQAEALGISSATWPLFGVVWPSSRILANTVCVMELAGKRVLEIGCGIALSSIVLHDMGIDITASDYHPLAKEFLDANILANNMLPIKYYAGNWETENPQLDRFDVIIGSDILYEPAHADLVSQFIDRHAKYNGVKVVIVDPNRGNRAAFTKKMLSLGYTHQFERFDNNNESGEIKCKGRILHYCREELSGAKRKQDAIKPI